MKRMKSELKRYQASEVTPPSAPPSARKSLDLDISLARNEIVCCPIIYTCYQAYDSTAY
jgi:hypothetical protein